MEYLFFHMKWIVKIVDKPELRIAITFNPMFETLLFTGQYKIKTEWHDFSSLSSLINIDLEKIKELLFDTYEKLNARVEAYKNLDEGLKFIILIEVNNTE